MDKLRSMETFIAVVESGSFTGAAARLEMSAVMVGKYVALLESQLGTRLLERNTRRQSLTDAGRVYFDEAKRVLEQVAIAESAVERLRAAPSGTLRVTAPTSFGGSAIAPLTASFLQRYPEVRIELDLTNRMVDLVEKLNAGDYPGACREILRWTYFQGKNCAAPENACLCGGLATRRQGEYQQCLGEA